MSDCTFVDTTNEYVVSRLSVHMTALWLRVCIGSPVECSSTRMGMLTCVLRFIYILSLIIDALILWWCCHIFAFVFINVVSFMHVYRCCMPWGLSYPCYVFSTYMMKKLWASLDVLLTLSNTMWMSKGSYCLCLMCTNDVCCLWSILVSCDMSAKFWVICHVMLLWLMC